MLTLVVGSIFLLLAAISYPTISTTLVNSGLFDPIPANFVQSSTSGPTSCEWISNDANLLSGCENGQTIMDGKFAFLACSLDVTSRYKWFPPTQKWDSSLKPTGGITLYDFTTDTALPLTFEGFPDHDYVPHGISALVDENDPSQVHIAAVNHKRGGSVIELFSHKLGSRSLVWRKTVNDQELLNAPNDVALVDKDTFYATNDVKSHGLMRKLALYLRLAHGRVVYYDGTSMKQVSPNIVYANGIVLGDNLQTVYVASTLERKLLIYARRADDTLRFVDAVDVGILGDNLAYDGKTGNVLVTGHSHAFKLQAAFDKEGPLSPTVVVRVSANTAKDLFYGKKYRADRVFVDDGRILSAGAISIVGAGDKSLVSGLFSRGVVVCNTSFFGSPSNPKSDVSEEDDDL